MAVLDLTMVLKLNDKATRKMERFNRVLDKTKKKLSEIGRLQAKNNAKRGTGRGAGAGGAKSGGIGLVGAAAGATALTGLSASLPLLQKSLIGIVATAGKFAATLEIIASTLQGSVVPAFKGATAVGNKLENAYIRINKSARKMVSSVNKDTSAIKRNTRAKKQNKKASSGLLAMLSRLKVGWILIVGAGILAIKNIIRVGREFQVMRATLAAVIPESDNIGEAFAFLQGVTKQLPSDMKEVTTAFIRMQALGLAPTEEKLLSFGNTAAASGKSVIFYVEAVADAIVGEMERLKEFGIKAKQFDDTIEFTFRGVTDSVDRNANAITKYLASIGSDLPSAFKVAGVFAGAATKQMDTLDGAISNLGVETDLLADNIFQALEPALQAAVSVMTDFASWLNKVVVTMRQWLVFTIGGFDELTIKTKAWAAEMFASEKELVKIAEQRKQDLQISRNTVKQMVKELDALTNIDEAAKKYSKTLDKRAAEQDKVTLGMKVTAIQTQSLAEFMLELEETVIKADNAQENMFEAQKKLNEMFQSGELDAAEFQDRIEVLNEMMGVELPESVNELNEFWKQAFRNMQSDLANFFADATTRKFKSFKDGMQSLALSFAQTINRMVAQWLAAKVLTSGFGMFGITAGGTRSFADGGRPPLNVPSIIGERGPELFVPDTAGTIIPNEQMGSKNVSISITAMDSQGVMQALESNKRGITELVFGTQQTYNMSVA